MLLTALRLKGETVDEIVGAARALRERAIRIPARRSGLLDTCGTGGDELQHLQHQHGDRLRDGGLRSAGGEALQPRRFQPQRLGRRARGAGRPHRSVPRAEVARAIDEIGLGFCFAPVAHGAMKYAAPVRKQLGFRTIFNLLGPLTNPAGPSSSSSAPVASRGRRKAGRRRWPAWGRIARWSSAATTSWTKSACGARTTLLRVEKGTIEASEWTAGLSGPATNAPSLTCGVSSAAESAEMIRDVLSGVTGAARNIVLANTAAALIVAQNSREPREAVAVAAAAIDSRPGGGDF